MSLYGWFYFFFLLFLFSPLFHLNFCHGMPWSMAFAFFWLCFLPWIFSRQTMMRCTLLDGKLEWMWIRKWYTLYLSLSIYTMWKEREREKESISATTIHKYTKNRSLNNQCVPFFYNIFTSSVLLPVSSQCLWLTEWWIWLLFIFYIRNYASMKLTTVGSGEKKKVRLIYSFFCGLV